MYVICIGLNRINRLIYYETSYQNQFPGYWLQSSNGGVQNVLVVDDSTSDENTNKIETEQVQDNENVCFNSLQIVQVEKVSWL